MLLTTWDVFQPGAATGMKGNSCTDSAQVIAWWSENTCFQGIGIRGEFLVRIYSWSLYLAKLDFADGMWPRKPCKKGCQQKKVRLEKLQIATVPPKKKRNPVQTSRLSNLSRAGVASFFPNILRWFWTSKGPVSDTSFGLHHQDLWLTTMLSACIDMNICTHEVLPWTKNKLMSHVHMFFLNLKSFGAWSLYWEAPHVCWIPRTLKNRSSLWRICHC